MGQEARGEARQRGHLRRRSDRRLGLGEFDYLSREGLRPVRRLDFGWLLMVEVCLYIDGRRVGEEEVGECRCWLYPISWQIFCILAHW